MRKKNKHSVQHMLGIKEFSDYGLSTEHGELIFFAIRPQNISVLSQETIAQKVRQLQQLLSAVPELEILCLDCCESFADNQRHIKSLLEVEQNSAVQSVLAQDLAHLDGIQIEMATARQFLYMLRLKHGKPEQTFAQANRVEKAITEQGFEVKRLDQADILRLLKVYFGGFVAENEPPALEQLLPATVKFNVDHYIRSDRYCCAWALKDYPPSTDMQALFAQLADRAGVTLRICNRPVESHEQRKILQNATRKNRFAAHANDAQESINAEENLHDVATLLANLRRNREPLLHCAVFLELHAVSLDKLRELQQEINMELTRSKLGVDRLTLRQQDGFLSAWPCGFNQFDAQFERVLPASSVANFYPLNYSGKTDPAGFYIGRDTFGTNILVDFDRRAEDKSNANILILGNSGQGKSYLMKLVLANLRAAGKRVFALDAEAEYEDLTHALGGCYVDLTDGSFRINPLDPRGDLKEHIAYLKDFFRAYKDFSDEQIDTIELLLGKLYAKNESPTMSDFYVFIEQEHARKGDELYSSEVLSELLLSLHSMCRGAESKFFDGYTNVTDSDFLCFGVKGLMGVNQRLRDALLFNLLSFMSHALLVRGNTVAAIDEIYLYLNNQTAIEYIRNCMKRVRKQESAMILATQNISDFLIPAVKEYTKPLFAIPTHQFLFYPGNIDPRDFTDTLQLEQAEFDLIRQPKTGHCLFKCGNERYYLHVIAPEHKRAMFGSGGGR